MMSEQLHEFELRRQAIQWWLQGERPVDICRALNKPHQWFAYWRKRYNPDDIDSLRDKSPVANRVANRIPEHIETMVINSRASREARDTPATKYALIGADAIYYELRALDVQPLPTSRTIHRILVRHGKIKPRQPVRRNPSGKWYPIPPAKQINDVQQLDLIGPRYLQGDKTKYYIMALRDVVSLCWCIAAVKNRQAQTIAEVLIANFKRIGRPHILQMDNGTEFIGTHRYPRSFGLIVKLCLDIGITPWFIAPKEPWRNGLIEQGNGLIDELLWKQQTFANFQQMQMETSSFADYCNRHHCHKKLDGLTSDEYVQQHAHQLLLLAPDYDRHHKQLLLGKGQIVFVRMVRKSGRITIKADDKFDITPDLKYEYVQAIVDTDEEVLRVYHQDEPVKEFEYTL